MMIYGWREREEVLRFFEKVTGLRMNHNYIRPGGVAADLPDGWPEDVVGELLELMLPPAARRVRHPDDRATDLARTSPRAVGAINTEECTRARRNGPHAALHWLCLGLAPRRAVLSHVRRTVDFDVIVGTYGDCYDRYAIRLAEIRESMRIVRQCIEKMPRWRLSRPGQERSPHRRGCRIDESMEALIHHFKIFTEGYKVPRR